MAREIYLQFDFLVQFYQEKPNQDLIEFNEQQKLWYDFHSFLSEDNLELTIGLDADVFENLKEANPFLIYFYNLFGQGKDIFLDVQPFEELENDNFYQKGSFCKFFALTESEQYCDLKIEKYGFLFFNNSSLYQKISKLSIKYLEDNNLRSLKLGAKTANSVPKLNDWKDLKNYAHPINSIIICDRYLLNSDYGFKDNLMPMLKILLNPKTHTDILILGNEFKLSLSKFEENIKTELPNFDITISICKISLNDSHDRMIFTNFFHIKSGQSFTYFKNGKVNTDIASTTLDFNSFFGQNSWLVALDFLKEIKSHIPEQDKIGEEIISIGTKQNRLLS